MLNRSRKIYLLQKNAIAGMGELPIIEPGGFQLWSSVDSSGQVHQVPVSDTIPVQIGSVLNF